MEGEPHTLAKSNEFVYVHSGSSAVYLNGLNVGEGSDVTRFLDFSLLAHFNNQKIFNLASENKFVLKAESGAKKF